MKAYFNMINAQGGVNGRKLTWISYDDGYSPPKTVEMTRKLVERKVVSRNNGLSGTIRVTTGCNRWHLMRP
jgi:hypothetical protein